MKRIVLLAWIWIALLLSSCSSSSKTITATLPVAGNDEWTVRMTHSGGIMGLMRSVEVSSDGNFTVTNERENQTVAGKLSVEETATLAEIIANTKYVTLEKPGMSVCADCFIYNVEIQGSGKKFAAQLDDISLPDSGMETLVTFLRAVINSVL